MEKQSLTGISSRINKETLESIVLELGDAITEGFILLRDTDPVGDFSIDYINSVCCQLFKLERKNLMGTLVSSHIHTDSFKLLNKTINSNRNNRIPIKLNLRSASKGKAQWDEEFGLVNLPTGLIMLRLIKKIEVGAAEILKQNNKDPKNPKPERVGVFSLDDKGICKKGNPDFFRLFGRNRKDFINQSWLRYICSLDKSMVEHALVNLHQKGGVWNKELRIIKNDGALNWVLCVLSRYSDTRDSNEDIQGFLFDINLTKIDKLKLKESQERYRFFSDVTFEGIILHNKGIIVDVNASFTRIMGYTRKDAIGENLLSYIPQKEDLALAQKKISDSYASPYRLNLKRKDGVSFIGEIESRQLTDNLSDIRVSTIRDVTEKVKIEQALRESDSKYKAIVENNHDGIYIYRGDHFLFTNKRIQEYSGYSADELLAMNIWGLLHPDDREVVRDYGRKRAANKPTRSYYEARILCKNGDVKACEFSVGSVLYNNEYAALGVVRDISHREKAKNELEISEQKFRTLAQQAPNLIVSTNNELRIEYINRSLPGIVPKMKAGDKISAFIPEYVRNKFLELIISLDNNKPYSKFEFSYQMAQQKFYFEVRMGILYQDGEEIKGYIFNFNDVSEHKKYETILEESEKRFREMVENLPSGAILIENEHLYLNKRAAEIIEYSNDEIKTPKQFFTKLFGDKAKGIQIIFDKEKADGFKKTLELSAHTRTGQIKQIEIAGRTYQNSVVWLIRDISDYVKAREEINLQADALEKSLNSFFIIDTQGKFIYINQAYLLDWGYFKTTDVIGQSIEKHFQSKKIAKEMIANVIREGKIKREYTAQRKDGSHFEILLSAFLYKGNNGNQLIAGSSMDITEQNKNLAELNKYKSHLEEIVNERTLEIGSKNEQLERMNNLFVGREFRIKELRDEVKILKERLHKYENK